MRRVLFILITLVTFTIGTGFDSGLRLLEAGLPPLYPPYMPQVQLDSSKQVDPLDPLWCGDLVVRIEPDGELTLDSSSIGTIDDTEALALRLMEIFRERREAHLRRHKWECGTDVPLDAHIPRRVFIKVPESAKFSDVARVLDAVKSTGAYPVGLVLERRSGGFSSTSN